MKFHNVHGTAITLTENKSVATRSDNSFCHGLVFGDQPLKTGQKVCLELTCTLNWSGALRVGFTSSDPGKSGSKELPKYAVPYLSRKEGFWVRPISEALTGDGVRLMFYVSSQGHAQFFVNNEHKGALLANLPTDKPLWILFDVYGNTKAIRFVRPDDAPKEIMARGPEAVQAYESACRSGVRPVRRTRLMLVGQEGAGKTSLKRVLIGQQHNRQEERTDGIDLSFSCSFKVMQREKWATTVNKPDETDDASTEPEEGIMGGSENLEEEYHQALATNIVQELLYQKRHKASTTQKPRTAGSTKDQPSKPPRKLSTKPSSASNITASKLNDIPAEMFSEMPERVVELVQHMLDQGSEVKGPDSKSHDSFSMTPKAPEGSKVVLNIWDFAGQSVYYTTHQVFLTSRAVYLIVFNLNHDLQVTQMQADNQVETDEELSTLGYMDFWMRSVYAHASQNTKSSVDNTTFSPPIIIVGTHRGSLDSDPAVCNKIVEEKFAQIRDFITGKPYVQHLVTPFFAIENSLEQEDSMIEELRQKIEEVSSVEPYMGEQMPTLWIRFEQELRQLVASGTNYASFDQLKEIAANLGISESSEVSTLLEFYHDLGVLIYYGGGKGHADNLLRNTVILRPQWLIDMFKYVMSSRERTDDKWNLLRDKWTRLQEFGILEEVLLDKLWQEALDQKLVLIGLMEKFDLICPRLALPSESQTAGHTGNRTFYVPSRLGQTVDSKSAFTGGDKAVTFYIDFHGFLPDNLFHRILTRTVRWTQECGGQNPYSMFQRKAHFYLDTEHDFLLEMAARQFHRIKITVLKVSESDVEEENVDTDGQTVLSSPRPQACAKVRNFLETCLTDLREMWMKRISYSVCVPCPCGLVCEPHKLASCRHDECIHFLNLDECLSNKVVCCEHRRVKTSPIRKCYPEPLTLGFNGPVLPAMALNETCGNIEKHCPALPSWMKRVAKLLNVGEKGKDWQALGKELGYKENQLNHFNDDLNPGLALLADWIITSGNTGLSVDMLTVYLEKMEREDVLEIIQKAQESETEPAQIFVSYQWDSQDEVKVIRDKLERSGFTCWMDIGQMGGGDQLYTRVDEGIRNSKVVLACISPKFVVSRSCVKELSLADLLCKPIIPVLIDPVQWPPPGALSLILAQLVYINMRGVGGHGGTGIHADRNNKFNEIIQRVSLFAIPDLSRCTDTETEPEDKKSQLIDCDGGSSMEYSVNEITDQLSQQSSLMVLESRAYDSNLPLHRDVTIRTVEQVHVARCRVCVIL